MHLKNKGKKKLVSQIIDLRLMCKEAGSCLSVDQTHCRDLRSGKGICFRLNLCEDRGSSHYCSLWVLLYGIKLLSSAVKAQKMWDKTSPLIRDHHFSFHQLNCPVRVTLGDTYTSGLSLPPHISAEQVFIKNDTLLPRSLVRLWTSAAQLAHLL